jgi:hypothetical protein
MIANAGRNLKPRNSRKARNIPIILLHIHLFQVTAQKHGIPRR